MIDSAIKNVRKIKDSQDVTIQMDPNSPEFKARLEKIRQTRIQKEGSDEIRELNPFGYRVYT